MKDAFRNGASLYEAFSDSRGRLEREGPLLLDLLAQAPGNRVVDLACGTGPHALFLAEHGAEVTACDISEEMIAHALQRRPHSQITYRRADMREVSSGSWDLALCLGNSLSLLATQQDLEKTFAAVSACLAPYGLFALQVLNYRSEAAQNPRHRIERREGEGARVTAVKNLVPDNGRTFLSLSYFVHESGECCSLSETAVLRNLEEDDLLEAARHAGLAHMATYGAYDKRPYAPENSPDLIMVLSKA